MGTDKLNTGTEAEQSKGENSSAANNQAAAPKKKAKKSSNKINVIELKNGKLKEIEFLKSPSGAFGLAYWKGEKVKINEKIADVLISSKYAK